MEKYGRARQATDVQYGRMRSACCITKATNTHSEYVILTAFPLQQWLHERASMLRYTYISCIVILVHRRITAVLAETRRCSYDKYLCLDWTYCICDKRKLPLRWTDTLLILLTL